MNKKNIKTFVTSMLLTTLVGTASFQLDHLHATMNAAARQARLAMIISLHYSAACTGFVCRSAYLSSLPSWYTSASVDLERPTWPIPFSRSPGFPVDNACGHRRRPHWTSRPHDQWPIQRERAVRAAAPLLARTCFKKIVFFREKIVVCICDK